MNASSTQNEAHICWGGKITHHTHHKLEVSHLYYNYGKTKALIDISFEVTCGHSLALIGPNGAGKSTLLKALCGIIKPDAGSLLWRGKQLTGTNKEIAYLPQRSQVNWSFPITVRALVEMGRYPSTGAFKRFRQHDHDIVTKALATLNLEDLQNRQIGELSGGQQQRVFLARALAQEAHILLLDEPFTGLDSPNAQILQNILKSFTKEGRLLIASHHDLTSVEALFDKTILLNQNLILQGDSSEIMNSPITHETFTAIKHV